MPGFNSEGSLCLLETAGELEGVQVGPVGLTASGHELV